MRPALVIGVGCKRGASVDAIERAIRLSLGDSLAFADIACVASIEAKRDEAGLIAFGERHRLPLHFFGANEISSVTCEPSAQACQAMNVDGVCEPCALIAGGASATLLVHKTVKDGVTVAIARTSSNNEA
ncbi:Cobalamin biosynthesis protein CbiG [Candidatus Burkholderia brachyanthoides]|nr:Cobalamin biosynthesis protein CbiG [Candidatus Burkholderia brachyanthoides]